MSRSKAYETPPAYFRERWERHHFTVDAAASDSNALLRPLCVTAVHPWVPVAERRVALEWSEPGGQWNGRCLRCQHFIGRYYTAETDGLNPDHYKPGDRVWCNPPYDTRIIDWVKLARSLSMDGGILWELLLPASTDTRWFGLLWNDRAGHWRDGVEGHFVGRIQFLLNGKPITDARGKVVSSRQSNLLVTCWPRGELL